MAALCVLHNALCLLCQPVVQVASGTRNEINAENYLSQT